MHTGTTLTQFIIEEQRRTAGATGDFTSLLWPPGATIVKNLFFIQRHNHSIRIFIYGARGSSGTAYGEKSQTCGPSLSQSFSQ